jgi:hypothetical protein
VGTSTTTSYVFANLTPGTTYTVGVRAVDGRGNRSETITSTFYVPADGVMYKYYELVNPPSSLATIDFSVAPTKTGVVNNFAISVRSRNDQFAFSFDGFIQIDEVGTYTFYTSSDDGSRLYINGVLVVENDGLHGTIEKSGIYTFNAIGRYPIKVTFFENGGGEVLQVSYDPTGSAPKQAIPNNKLFLIGDSSSSSARISQDASIPENDEVIINSTGVAVYPNPFSDRINVSKGSLQSNEIRIFDHMGMLVKTIEVKSTMETSIELQDLPRGIYYMSIGTTKIRLLKKE